LPLDGQRLDLFRQPLEFFEPDFDKFRCLALAFEAIHRGGNMPCILNAANEIVNEAFRQARCSFIAMADIIEKIDIGGISLIRAAAKNFNDVVIVPSKEEYSILLKDDTELKNYLLMLVITTINKHLQSENKNP